MTGLPIPRDMTLITAFRTTENEMDHARHDSVNLNHRVTDRIPPPNARVRQWRLACLTAGLVAVSGIGCTIDSAGLAREVAAIRQAREATGGKGTSDRVQALAERVRHFSEDVVTQAYVKAGSREERLILLGVISRSCYGEGRFIPLLCYVIQFSEHDAESTRAALVFSRVGELEGPFRKSSVVLVLGNRLAATKDAKPAQLYAHSLAEFLRRACSYTVPSSERVVKERPPSPGDRGVIVTQIDTDVVRAWWVREGQALALAGHFDRDAPATQ
jgi:hypothetical protein